MGAGDEIMALGRAEKLFEETGTTVSICNELDQPREHILWKNNPAWDKNSKQKLRDGAGCRPYILHWRHRQSIFNLNYRPRAGKIYLTDSENDFFKKDHPYAVISPNIKNGASVNKNWGYQKWEKVIKNFPIPVYQGIYDSAPIEGVIPIKTDCIRKVAAMVSGASIVLTNEGGLHHIAASFKTPAVVIFGSFIPPKVTGYDFHCNIHRETEHGFCGRWDYCHECQSALKSITIDEVREQCLKILEKNNAARI